MQKIFNLLTLFSATVSAGILIGGGYLHSNKEQFIDNIKQEIIVVLESSLEKLKPEMPELPNTTGGVVKESSQTGGVIPF